MADSIGVTENSITGWELNRHEVQVKWMPKVLEFLGYYPWDENTLGEKLKAWRMRNGIPIKRLIKIINMEGNTIKNAESDDFSISKSIRRKIEIFLDKNSKADRLLFVEV